jgi:hypothetical protein
MKNRFYIFITLTLILSCQLHSCENKANKKTFIMTAVEKNDLAVVQLLIAHDNLININNEELYKLCLQAIQNDSLPMLQLLDPIISGDRDHQTNKKMSQYYIEKRIEARQTTKSTITATKFSDKANIKIAADGQKASTSL